MPRLAITGDAEADRLLSASPLALLIGMLLDQQIPMERAFHAPFELSERLGGPLDAAQLVSIPPEELAGIFARPPALHRYPASMAKRVQDLCRTLSEDYGGAKEVWSSASTGSELLGRLKSLPGFGDDKARKFVALLGKQLGVTPTGWREACAPFGEAGIHKSVADISGPGDLELVRSYKRSMKAAARARST